MGTISKALQLLDFISASTPEMGLIEFAKACGRDKATVHRYLVELAENGFLEQNTSTKKYRLGPAILRLSAIREQTFPIKKIVSERVEKLASEFGELVHASLIQGMAMSPISFHDGGVGSTRVYFDEAEMLPFHATSSGFAAVAFGPGSILKKLQSKKLEKFTRHTPTSHDRFLKLVKQTRDDGYAFCDQAFEAEVCSIAVPFYEAQSPAIGSLAVAVPQSRIETKKISEMARVLWKESQAISHELGGSIPASLKLQLEERKLI